MTSKPPIPQFPSQWKARAAKLKVLDTSMSQLEKVDSASKMSEEQFICMRVLWPKPKAAKEFPNFDEAMNDRISNMMNDFPEFDAYIGHIRKGTRGFNDRAMGGFQLVMQSQRNVSTDRKVPGLESDSVVIQRSVRVQNQPRPSPERTPRPSTERTGTPGSVSATSDAVSTTVATSIISTAADSDVPFRQTIDEQLVNDALLLFLRILTVHLPDMRCEWSSIRSPFIKTSFGANTMTARIDGCLVGVNTPEIFAIVEVKPRVRNRAKWPELLWQETGEMVSWILHDRSQDRATPVHQRLLYEDEYVQYLRDELLTPTPQVQPFMRMEQYGPWNIQNASSMKGLAKILVGWAFKVTDDIASSRVVT
ncbi:hypothetical protein LT330_007152 [Penicillium expansum]|nr:hypothetical protein LT330_007152 [Penicillium expansum]